jgi:hypothetical protein
MTYGTDCTCRPFRISHAGLSLEKRYDRRQSGLGNAQNLGIDLILIVVSDKSVG